LATDALFDDERFASARFMPDPDAALALTPEMERFLEERIGDRVRERGALYGLIQALYEDGQLKLAYDASTTRTASETFRERRGNCLSLVLMTAAFAQRLGLEARYQRVITEDTPEQVGEMLRMVGHVNVGLAKRGTARVRDWITVDFLPGQEAARLRTAPISEGRVKSMFLNNKAVEALGRGELARAYWWARASVVQDPRFASPFVTVGVLWHELGDADRSRNAFRHALTLDPDNASAQANLQQGTGSAPVLHLAGSRGDPSVARAVAALKLGDPASARTSLEEGQAAALGLSRAGRLLQTVFAIEDGATPRARQMLRALQSEPGLDAATQRWISAKLRWLSAVSAANAAEGGADSARH
jgi:tetratricopeptide (TPR) repeat protein